jgi:hypothetical protein
MLQLAAFSVSRDPSSANRNLFAGRGDHWLADDVAWFQPDCIGHDLRRHRLAEAERLRGGETGCHHGAVLADEVERDRPGALLEHQALAGRPADSGEHERGADIGMAGERQLRLRGEDADMRGVQRDRGAAARRSSRQD